MQKSVLIASGAVVLAVGSYCLYQKIRNVPEKTTLPPPALNLGEFSNLACNGTIEEIIMQLELTDNQQFFARIFAMHGRLDVIKYLDEQNTTLPCALLFVSACKSDNLALLEYLYPECKVEDLNPKQCSASFARSKMQPEIKAFLQEHNLFEENAFMLATIRKDNVSVFKQELDKQYDFSLTGVCISYQAEHCFRHLVENNLQKEVKDGCFGNLFFAPISFVKLVEESLTLPEVMPFPCKNHLHKQPARDTVLYFLVSKKIENSIFEYYFCQGDVEMCELLLEHGYQYKEEYSLTYVKTQSQSKMCQWAHEKEFPLHKDCLWEAHRLGMITGCSRYLMSITSQEEIDALKERATCEGPEWLTKFIKESY